MMKRNVLKDALPKSMRAITRKPTYFPKENQFANMRVSILSRKSNVHKLVLEKYMRWANAKGLSRESSAK